MDPITVYKMLDKVFGKQKFSCPWPAKIIHVKKAESPSKNRYYVYFYGTHNYGVFLSKSLSPYAKAKSNKGNERKLFKKALKEIEEDDGNFGIPKNVKATCANVDKAYARWNTSKSSAHVNKQKKSKKNIQQSFEAEIEVATTSAKRNINEVKTLEQSSSKQDNSTKGVKKIKVSKMDKRGSFCYLQDTITGVTYDLLEEEQFVTISKKSPSSLLIERVYKPSCHFIIKFEKRQFNIYRNIISNVSTNVNWTEIKEDNSVELNNKDFITFGKPHNNISYMFCTSIKNNEEPKLVNNEHDQIQKEMDAKLKRLNTQVKLLEKSRDAKEVEMRVMQDGHTNTTQKFNRSLKNHLTTIKRLKKKNARHCVKNKSLTEQLDNCILLVDESSKSVEKYQKQAIQLLENHFTCLICHEVAINIYSTTCFHIFCMTCIFTWLYERIDCPCCRQDVFVLTYNRSLEQYISSIYKEIGGEVKEQRDTLFNERAQLIIQKGMQEYKGQMSVEYKNCKNYREQRFTSATGISILIDLISL